MSISEVSRVKPRGLWVGVCVIFLAFALVQAGDEDSAKKKAKEPQRFVYKDKGKRNPFVPLVSDDGRFVNLEPPEKKSDLMLEGIIYDPHGISYALVNSAVVKVSDIVDGYQVLRIHRNKVVFIKDGNTKEVFIKKED